MAQIGNLGSLRVGLELPIKKWNKNYGKVTDDVKKYPKKTEKALNRAGQAWEKHAGSIKKASLGMVAFGTATVAALGFAVKAAGDFQQSMVNTQSVAGATAEELKQLTSFAREMGKVTVFSAKESADAMYSLASAGQDTQEIMNSLKGTLNLAAATNSDLAFTSRTVASTISQFGFAASESDRIANVFTATISASQATMDKLATSMSLVGPVARSIGMSLEETTGILGSLFNAGLDASTAGTSLRQSIAQLLKPTDDAKEALKRLKVQTVDSAGNLRNLTDIIRDLESSGLSAADALTIFGVRAGPGMLALVSKGADAIEDLTEKVTGTNKAAEIAALQIDTFQGKMKILNSAVSELKITIGNELLPILTDYATKLSVIINRTSDWAKANPRLTSTLVKVGGVASVAAIGLGGIGLAAPGIMRTGKALGLLGRVAWGPIGIGIAAVGASIAIVAVALNEYKKARKDVFIGQEMRAVSNNARLIEQEILKINTQMKELAVLQERFGKNPVYTNRLNALQKHLASLEKELRITKGDIDHHTASIKTAATATGDMADATTNAVGATIGMIGPLVALKDPYEDLVDLQGQWLGGLFVTPKALKETVSQTKGSLAILDNAMRTSWDKRQKMISDFEKKDITGKTTAATLGTELDEASAKKGVFWQTFEHDERKKIVDNTNRIMGDLTKQQLNAGERVGKAMVANAANTASEFAQIWEQSAMSIEFSMSDLFASMIDPSIKPAWKQLWDSLERIAINAAADILAAQAAKGLLSLLDLTGVTAGGGGTGGTIKQAAIGAGTGSGIKSAFAKIFGTKAATTAATTAAPNAATAIGAISGATKLGILTSAVAGTVIPVAVGAGILASISDAIASAGERKRETAENQRIIARGVKAGAQLNVPNRLLAAQQGLEISQPELFAELQRQQFVKPSELFAFLQKEQRVVAGKLGQVRAEQPRLAIDELPRFVPHRPEGTDRFGRTLPATVAMAPGRGGNVTFGDVIINNEFPNVTDIRDLDSAEMERLTREGTIPALEALGFRLVRSDNLMAS